MNPYQSPSDADQPDPPEPHRNQLPDHRVGELIFAGIFSLVVFGVNWS